MKTVCIIGAGPAGMAAALSANSVSKKIKVILIDRDPFLGGILNQCIHTGFGIERFGEELTGPDYSERFINEVKNSNIEILSNSTVFKIKKNRKIYLLNPDYGLKTIHADAVVLAMGCRERPRGAIHLPGTRPAGIFTAGLAQKLLNIDGSLPGRDVVILGSGDIGLITARRLTLEGARIKGVIEIKPYAGGLARNVVQCLYDYNIPLYLSHTITRVEGRNRVQRVYVSRVDENKNSIRESEFTIDCDTLLLSIGLIPENELTESIEAEMDDITGGPVVDEYFHSSASGFFVCGNVLHVHDIVDRVSSESEEAGRNAALYALGKIKRRVLFTVKAGQNLSYVLPQRVSGLNDVKFKFRVTEPIERATIRCDGYVKSAKYLHPQTMRDITINKDYLKKNNTIDIIKSEKGN